MNKYKILKNLCFPLLSNSTCFHWKVPQYFSSITTKFSIRQKWNSVWASWFISLTLFIVSNLVQFLFFNYRWLVDTSGEKWERYRNRLIGHRKSLFFQIFFELIFNFLINRQCAVQAIYCPANVKLHKLYGPIITPFRVHSDNQITRVFKTYIRYGTIGTFLKIFEYQKYICVINPGQ